MMISTELEKDDSKRREDEEETRGMMEEKVTQLFMCTDRAFSRV